MAERDLDWEVSFFEGVYSRDKRDCRVIELLGHLYTKTGQVNEGLRMDRRMVRLQPDNALAHYNLGCSLALKKRKKDAVESLKRAVALGYTDLAWMLRDSDLEALRNYPGFHEIIELLHRQTEETES